jgi:L-rhamnose isomerase / sugar isomerase
MAGRDSERIFQLLEAFRIEIPSWGFANTGTRFGKFLQPAAAATTEEKFSDAGQVHRMTGVCPTIALHVLWDCPEGVSSAKTISALAMKYCVQAGSINTNLFQDQIYKFGSFGNPDPEIRKHALQQMGRTIRAQQTSGSERNGSKKR